MTRPHRQQQAPQNTNLLTTGLVQQVSLRGQENWASESVENSATHESRFQTNLAVVPARTGIGIAQLKSKNGEECTCTKGRPRSPKVGQEDQDMDKMTAPTSPTGIPIGGWKPKQAIAARASGHELPNNWLPGVDFHPAGTVVCTGAADPKTYTTWINPVNPPWLQPCVQAHENRHVSDFQADGSYRSATRCVGIDNGKIWSYGAGHAKRFECNASDTEIKCLRERIPTMPTQHKIAANNRIDQMMAYRLANGCPK